MQTAATLSSSRTLRKFPASLFLSTAYLLTLSLPFRHSKWLHPNFISVPSALLAAPQLQPVQSSLSLTSSSPANPLAAPLGTSLTQIITRTTSSWTHTLAPHPVFNVHIYDNNVLTANQFGFSHFRSTGWHIKKPSILRRYHRTVVQKY